MLKLHCGDYANTINDVADLILTSPPYNIGSSSDAVTGKRKHGLYDPKSYRSIREYPDNLPEAEYQDSQVAFLRWAAAHIKQDGVVVYNHKPRRKAGAIIHPLTWIARVEELTLVEEVVWDRTSTHNHCPQMMWQQTERLYVLRRTDGKYRLNNHRGLAQRSDVWRIPRAQVNGHNAPFPIAMAEAAIEAWCPAGGLVIDPYAGSGTTAIAAIKTGRSFVGSEALQKYHALALSRIQLECGNNDGIQTKQSAA